jgi:hypothetical protein
MSLADEYTEWERVTKLKSGEKSRIEKFLENLNSGNRSSYYKEFVRARQFKNEGIARKYVGYGVQLRVFMKLYSSSLDVDTEALGMAGIISLKFWAMIRIKYPDMPLLARLLRSEWGEYASTKGTWMESCSRLFKGINPYHEK